MTLPFHIMLQVFCHWIITQLNELCHQNKTASCWTTTIQQSRENNPSLASTQKHYMLPQDVSSHVNEGPWSSAANGTNYQGHHISIMKCSTHFNPQHPWNTTCNNPDCSHCHLQTFYKLQQRPVYIPDPFVIHPVILLLTYLFS
jgi:hypothetical protein